MRIVSLWVLAAVVALVVVSAQPEGLPTQAFTDVEAADNRFGFALLARLTEAQNNKVFISPFSIALALGMTLAGATDATQQAMMKVEG